MSKNYKKKYQNIRESFLSKGFVNETMKDEIFKDMEELKKEYFYALGISIKLNQTLNGYSFNLDISKLYEEAKYLGFREWNGWLNAIVKKNQISQNRKSKRTVPILSEV